MENKSQCKLLGINWMLELIIALTVENLYWRISGGELNMKPHIEDDDDGEGDFEEY